MSYIQKDLLIESFKAFQISETLVDHLVTKMNYMIQKEVQHIEQQFHVKLLQQKLEIFEFINQLEEKRSQQIDVLTESYTTLKRRSDIQLDLDETIDPPIRETFGSQLQNRLININETNSPSYKKNVSISDNYSVETPISSSSKFSFKHVNHNQDFSILVDNPINDYLLNQDIEVKIVEPINYDLDQLALYMGENYRIIEPLYKKIKSSLVDQSVVTECISTNTPLEKSIICQWCTYLFRQGFLSEYDYRKSPKSLITLKIQKSSGSHNFLSGHWFERFIDQRIQYLLKTTSQQHRVSITAYSLLNAKVVLPTYQEDFEFDLLYMINNKLYWFETKTVYEKSFVNKYAKIAKLLNLKAEQAYFVLTKSSEHLKSVPKSNQITLTNFEELESILTNQILNS